MDRENIIKGLEIVSRMLNEIGRRNEMDIVDDAIALLKNQVPPNETFWDFLSEADLMEPMHHFED